MQSTRTKKELKTDVKKALLQDVGLAAKVINSLGGEISLPSFTQMVYRNSQSLTKTKVLSVIASSMKVDAEELLVESDAK